METRTYPTGERPLVAVLKDRTWYMGLLRMWERREDGWWGNVQYSLEPGDNRLDMFHRDDIVLVEDLSGSAPA